MTKQATLDKKRLVLSEIEQDIIKLNSIIQYTMISKLSMLLSFLALSVAMSTAMLTSFDINVQTISMSFLSFIGIWFFVCAALVAYSITILRKSEKGLIQDHKKRLLLSKMINPLLILSLINAISLGLVLLLAVLNGTASIEQIGLFLILMLYPLFISGLIVLMLRPPVPTKPPSGIEYGVPLLISSVTFLISIIILCFLPVFFHPLIKPLLLVFLLEIVSIFCLFGYYWLDVDSEDLKKRELRFDEFRRQILIDTKKSFDELLSDYCKMVKDAEGDTTLND